MNGLLDTIFSVHPSIHPSSNSICLAELSCQPTLADKQQLTLTLTFTPKDNSSIPQSTGGGGGIPCVLQ